MNETCGETVTVAGRWPTFKPCGRPVKETVDGKRVCGVHARVIHKRAERDQRWESEQRDSETALTRADAACRELAAYGIKARPYFSRPATGMGRYTGEVIVDGVQVLAALTEGTDNA